MGKAHMLRVAAITGGQNVPSARFRVRQYIHVLRALDVHLEDLHSSTSAYPPAKPWQRPIWAALRLAEMSKATLQSRHYDVTLLQREMISTLATLERWTGRPRVLDVDDAIHLFRDGTTAKTIATHCDRIICGNSHLAEIYRQWNSDVVVLPTPVDTERYHPNPYDLNRDTLVIGWIGTSANLHYLQNIEPALAAVLQAYPHVTLHIVCDKLPKLPTIAINRVKYSPWSTATEVADIQSFSIGLMPLEDSPWARGKCSFKMLQYMACGLPVVVSPVGMNAEVLKLGDIGIGAGAFDEWVEALSTLIENTTVRIRKGGNGREIALRDFSLTSLAPRFAGYLHYGSGSI
jgi:glycosyltransferase involved in cell wall biosynthesis